MNIARKTKRGGGVIGKVLNTIGEVADVVGLGVCRKHEAPVKGKKSTRKREKENKKKKAKAFSAI